MKSATVRDLRNNFARVSRWLQAGEKVEITKRGVPMCVVSPLPGNKNGKHAARKKFNLEEHRAWKKRVFGNRKFKDSIVLVMREEKDW
jgi:antitoxin (DNA-binding transcriptional repressor) of toxin-antitoxin stability system